VRLKRTHWILALLTLLALCAAGAYSVFYGWPVVRNAGYKAMVAEFSRAIPREPMRSGSDMERPVNQVKVSSSLLFPCPSW
jgi:hypothetical protein